MGLITTTRIVPITEAKTVGEILSCSSSASVGDLVRASKTTGDKVDVAINNSLKEPVIGIIISKPTTTTAGILFFGQLEITETLTQGTTVFLSATGTLTSTAPIGAGYLQVLGVVINENKILFNPQYRVVKRNA